MRSLVFPDRCNFCGDILLDSKLICKKCINSLPLLKGEKCDVCGRELSLCKCKTGDFAFKRNISFMRYEGPCRELIIRYKFLALPQLSKFMGVELARLVKGEYSEFDFDFISYVPMNFVKKLHRKYNPAQLLAEEISKELRIPLASTMSKRFTFKQQKMLNKKERIKFVKGKFKAKQNLKGKKILLVDDVFTTGATLNECCKVLRSSGAEYVCTVTFAIS